MHDGHSTEQRTQTQTYIPRELTRYKEGTSVHYQDHSSCLVNPQGVAFPSLNAILQRTDASIRLEQCCKVLAT